MMIKQEQKQQASLTVRGARKSINPRDQQFIRAAPPVAQYVTLQNKILTSKFSYSLFCNPAHKTEIRWRRLLAGIGA
jgi:hypothetical protein